MGTTKINLKMWPTPRVSDTDGGRILTEIHDGVFRSYRKNSSKWFGAKLRDAVETYMENWPTPDFSDRRSKNSKQHGLSNKVSGKLNPDWVECIMGLPSGLTQLSTANTQDENRIDRLRLLGNGVVPQTACKAFCTLLCGEKK